MAQEGKTVRSTAPAADAAGDAPRAVSVPTGGPPPLPARHRPPSASPPPAPEAASVAAEPAAPAPAPEDAATGEDESGRRQARRRPAGPSRGRIAANDDAPSIGGLIYALNQKPSNKPFFYAGVASGIWVSIGLGFAWMLVGPDLLGGKGFGDLVTRSGFLTGVATLLGPIALFWFLALLAWRTEELKLRSTAMTEVAVRLAEPDRMAEQTVASLGQAVRRQVSFMNDAVSRALGRAGELEALVHNEVTALERSYEENERKIRSLIQELAGERNALLTTGDRVSETLRTLGSEVPGLIETLANQQIKLARIIEGAGQNLTQLETAISTQTSQFETALGGRAEQLQQVIGSGAAQLQSVLGAGSGQLQTVIETYTSALGGALGHRSEQMEKLLSGYMEQIDGTIGGRTETLQTVFEEYARALDTTLANRAQALDMQLIERTKTLDNAFTERLRLFDESILRSTMAIDGAVGERANALTAAMEKHARNMTETIGRKAVELDETLMHGIHAVRRTSENITKQSLKAIEGLAGQSDLLKNVSENLLGQINGVTNRFENQGQAIMKAANALETANYKIDLTLQNRQAELGQTLDRMSGKAEDLSRVIQGYSSTLEGSLTEAEQRARQMMQGYSSTLEGSLTEAEQRARQVMQGYSSTLEGSLTEAEQRARQVMQGYSSTLEGSLTEAEQRARQIAQELASGAEARSRSTIEEIERLRHDASSQADRALDDLRSKFSNVSQEVTQQLGSLTEQFTATSSHLRDRTAAVASEFEAEQARIRAQVQELPTATRESTDAMRRALGDQLRALEQLSSLTSREAARRDVAAPAAPPPAQPSSLGSINYPMPPRDGARALSTLGNSLAQELGQRQATQPTAVALPTAAAVGAGGGDGRGNWSLGDLLARASSEEEAMAPQPARLPAPDRPVPPAAAAHGSGLNIDVVSRALDQATASAIWSRYRGGQRGVMVRSIYTVDGRAAFDEISRRYRSDLDFQQTVNRYLVDYERILMESDRRDPSGRLTHGQVVSDTGRVYLFLAHASGRLS